LDATYVVDELHPLTAPQRHQSLLPSRRRWVGHGLALLIGFAATFVVALGAWLVFVELRGSSSQVAAPGLSVRDLYHRVERAMTRPGAVYHPNETVTSKDEALRPHQQIESWVDTERDLVRQQVRPPGVAYLIANGEQSEAIRTVSGQPSEARSCYGTSHAVAMMLGCPAQDPSLDVSQQVRTNRVNGRRVVVLVTKTQPTSASGGDAFRGTNRLYFDAKSFLPIRATYDFTGSVAVGRDSHTKIIDQAIHRRSTFRNDFTPASVLPADFFTQSSISAWASATPPD
jgi:hypothetical protein